MYLTTLDGLFFFALFSWLFPLKMCIKKKNINTMMNLLLFLHNKLNATYLCVAQGSPSYDVMVASDVKEGSDLMGVSNAKGRI